MSTVRVYITAVYIFVELKIIVISKICAEVGLNIVQVEPIVGIDKVR